LPIDVDNGTSGCFPENAADGYRRRRAGAHPGERANDRDAGDRLEKVGPFVTTACAVVASMAAYWFAKTHGLGPIETPRWRGLVSLFASPLGVTLLFASGAYWLFYGLRGRQRERDSAHWPIADGMITATERARVFRTTTAPAVICDYSVNGKRYRTDAIPLDGADASYFQPGKIMALRYDPADPSVVVACARTSTANIWIAVAVLCVPLLSVLIT
jgi:hypothetical protein